MEVTELVATEHAAGDSQPLHTNSNPLRSRDGKYAVYFHSSEMMPEVLNETVNLVVTSPTYGLGLPYAPGKGGPAVGQTEGPVTSWEEYYAHIERQKPIWREVVTKMAPGAYLCLNAAPVHSKSQFFGESFMFPFLDDLAHFLRVDLGIQQRWKYYWLTQRSNNNSKGESQPVLGSYPMPLEGQVIRMAEEVLVFRKDGGRKLTEERMARRRNSKMSLKEWRDAFEQVWMFPGAKKVPDKQGQTHPAPFPEELPLRLIRAYSCVGDLVLDPFLGTGTTMLAARNLGRSCVGYEVQTEWRSLIAAKTHIETAPLWEP